MDKTKKVYSIHFPERKVYIFSTNSEIEEKMENIKNNKDHDLYRYFNPTIKEEDNDNEKEVANKYIKDSYKLLNVNLFPPSKYNLIQTLHKSLFY